MEYKGKLYAKINNKYIECTETVEDLENPILKTDINGKSIREGDKFRFKLLVQLHETIDLIGSFVWNQDELRYEIDIYDNEEYICLSYNCDGTMRCFEII